MRLQPLRIVCTVGLVTSVHSFLALYSADMIAVRDFEGRGRGLAAAVQIKAGDVVLEGSPCLLWTSQSGTDTSCAACLRRLSGVLAWNWGISNRGVRPCCGARVAVVKLRRPVDDRLACLNLLRVTRRHAALAL